MKTEKPTGGSQYLRLFDLHPLLTGLTPEAKDACDLLRNAWKRAGFSCPLSIIVAAAVEAARRDPRMWDRLLRPLAEEIYARRQDDA